MLETKKNKGMHEPIIRNPPAWRSRCFPTCHRPRERGPAELSPNRRSALGAANSTPWSPGVDCDTTAPRTSSTSSRGADGPGKAGRPRLPQRTGATCRRAPRPARNRLAVAPQGCAGSDEVAETVRTRVAGEAGRFRRDVDPGPHRRACTARLPGPSPTREPCARHTPGSPASTRVPPAAAARRRGRVEFRPSPSATPTWATRRWVLSSPARVTLERGRLRHRDRRT